MRHARHIVTAGTALAVASLLGGCDPDPWAQRELVSPNAAGTSGGNGPSVIPRFSADGTKIAFTSQASDLGPLDTNEWDDVYVRDLGTGTTTLASPDAAGTGTTDLGASTSDLSDDGTKVLFVSLSDGFGPTDTTRIRFDPGDDSDLYLRDLGTGTTRLVSANAAGTDSGNGSSTNGTFSPDGTKVVFTSAARNLGPALSDPGNGFLSSNVYLRDLATGTTSLVSLNASSTDDGNGRSSNPVFSPDGTKIAFLSDASDLGPTDTNGLTDLYVRDLVTGTTSLVTTNVGGTDSSNGSVTSEGLSFSPDGTRLVFESDAADLAADDGDQNFDVFVRDLDAGTTTLVSHDLGGEDPDDFSRVPVFSTDGTAIAFVSTSDRLGPNDTNGVEDVYLHDLATGTIDLVSANLTGTDAGDGRSTQVAFDPDGARIAFVSTASDLGVRDTDTEPDLYVKELSAGTVTRVTFGATGSEQGFGLANPVFAPDGRAIAFTSGRRQAGTADGNGVRDVYLATLHEARLSITGAASPEPVAAGAELTYRLRVDNAGIDPAEDAEAAMLLPEGTTFVDATATFGSCAGPTASQPRLVTCTLGDLTVGGSVEIAVTAGVDVGAPSGTTLTALAAVNATTPDAVTADDTTPITSTVL